jgi:hypothetical protein
MICVDEIGCQIVTVPQQPSRSAPTSAQPDQSRKLPAETREAVKDKALLPKESRKIVLDAVRRYTARHRARGKIAARTALPGQPEAAQAGLSRI